MADPKVKITVGARTSAELKRVLSGESAELQKFSKAATRTVRQRARETERIERDLAKTSKKLRDTDLKDFEKTERSKRRAVKQTARETERSEKSNAKARGQARREAGAQAGGLRGAVGGVAGQAGLGGFGGLAALAGGVVSARAVVDAAGAEGRGIAQGTAAIANIRSIAESIQGAAEFEELLLTTAQEARGAGDRVAVQQAVVQARETIFATAEATGIDPAQLLAGLRVQQVKFSQFDIGLATLQSQAEAARGTGEEFVDLVAVAGAASQAFGLGAEQGPQVQGLLRATGRAGGLSPGVIAQNFAGNFGKFVEAGGRSGLEGFQEFLALAQVGARQDPENPARVATAQRALFRAIVNPDIQARLATQGISTREFASEEERRRFQSQRVSGGGRLERALGGAEFERVAPTGARRSVTDILNQIEESNLSAERLQLIFGNERPVTGIQGILQNRRIADKATLEQLVDPALVAGGVEELGAAFTGVAQSTVGQIKQRGVVSNVAGFRAFEERVGSIQGKLGETFEDLGSRGGFGGFLANLVQNIPGIETIGAAQSRLGKGLLAGAGFETREERAGFAESLRDALRSVFGDPETEEGGSATVRIDPSAVLNVRVVDNEGEGDARRESGTP